MAGIVRSELGLGRKSHATSAVGRRGAELRHEVRPNPSLVRPPLFGLQAYLSETPDRAPIEVPQSWPPRHYQAHGAWGSPSKFGSLEYAGAPGGQRWRKEVVQKIACSDAAWRQPEVRRRHKRRRNRGGRSDKRGRGRWRGSGERQKGGETTEDNEAGKERGSGERDHVPTHTRGESERTVLPSQSPDTCPQLPFRPKPRAHVHACQRTVRPPPDARNHPATVPLASWRTGSTQDRNSQLQPEAAHAEPPTLPRVSAGSTRSAPRAPPDNTL